MNLFRIDTMETPCRNQILTIQKGKFECSVLKAENFKYKDK